MRTLFQDARYALRMLGKTPGVTAVILLTLALGIGANTAIFSFAYGVWLRPLPYPDSQRLMMVLAGDGTFGPVPLTSWSGLGQLSEWQEQNNVFEDMALFKFDRASLTGDGAPEQLSIAQVTPRFFETLGASPALGRTFATEAARPGQSDVVMLSANLWQQRFGSDPEVVGKPITLDGTPFTIVGVMPDDFRFPEDIGTPGPGGRRFRSSIDAWTGRMPQLTGHNALALQMVARLKQRVSLEQAQAEVATIAQRLTQGSSPDGERKAWLVPLQTYLAGDVLPLLLRLLGAVGFVLLIACANVASLLLARAGTRQKEVAVRTALGSGRARLIRQFLTESALLGLIGGLGGFLAAVWVVALLLALVPEGSLPRLSEVGINLPVLVFTLLTSVATGLLFGLMPALHSTKTDVNLALKEAGATQTRPTRLLNILVVTEVALALVLLAGAGLLIKSFVRLTNVDPGFSSRNVLTLSVTLPDTAYKTVTQMKTFHDQTLERFASMPGVDAIGAIDWLPFGGQAIQGDFSVEGKERLPAGLGWAVKSAVSPDYFRAIGIPIVRGRPFTNRDTAQSQGVAILTENLARRLWEGQDPLGKRIRIGFGPSDEEPWLSVVGIVREVKQDALSEEGAAAIYVPVRQTPTPFLLSQMTFVVRGSNPSTLAPSLRRQMQAIDPNLPVDRMITLDGLVAASVAEDRFRTVLLTGFAGLALALVATGVLGVLAYSVTQRAREIGLRMALGARNADIVRMVLRQAVLTTIVGVAIGIPAAAALTRLLASSLFDVKPNDAATFLTASALLVVVAVVAALVPARRAAGVDPLVVLRSE
jgi:putative ABC transport system permease protein